MLEFEGLDSRPCFIDPHAVMAILPAVSNAGIGLDRVVGSIVIVAGAQVAVKGLPKQIANALLAERHKAN